MRIRPARRTLDELTEEYEDDPRSWRIGVGNDERGYFDIFISNPREVWQVKVDSIYKPKPVGLSMKVGGRTEARRLLSKEGPSFGFRPISDEVLQNILGQGEGDLNHVLNEILKVEPRRLSDIGSSVVASGPVHFDARFQLSKRQKELDIMLRRNLKSFLHKKGFELEYG